MEIERTKLNRAHVTDKVFVCGFIRVWFILLLRDLSVECTSPAVNCIKSVAVMDFNGCLFQVNSDKERISSYPEVAVVH